MAGLPERNSELRAKGQLLLLDEALRVLPVALDFFGQFLVPLRIDFLGLVDQFFACFVVALDDLVQTSSAISCARSRLFSMLGSP